ncbi:hypothetical protein [Hymenobacter antarcticus]|uniref:Uncharacterized protein n=1 Tax=Hymenobacter antarcticus TaxID=486270 RepID=A0ABP7PD53_9BACT
MLLKSDAIEYRPDLHILFMRWLRPTILVELQESYDAALVLARQHQGGNWLLDARRTDPIETEETIWLADSFFPVASNSTA